MKVGQKVVVEIAHLPSAHWAIRFDPRQNAAVSFAPRGADGKVVALTPDGKEAQIELYWNDAPTGNPGGGHHWLIWVKREGFGLIFRTVF